MSVAKAGDKAAHQTALDRFKISVDAFSKQRERDSDAIRFADGQQWPEEVLAQRRGQMSAVGPVGARPSLTVNKLLQPLSQLQNGMRSARLAPEISPKGGNANRETAEVLQGLYRHIEVMSRAQQARQWAFQRAIKTGLGFYRILTEYSNDGDDDQDIVIKRILNQASVYLDPYAVEPDWSDGMWAFITSDYSPERYKREFPDSKMGLLSNDELTALGDTQPSWITKDQDGQPLIRVAEYYRVELVKRERHTFADGSRAYAGDEDYPQGMEPILKRQIEDRQIKYSKINAVETLEEADYDGRFIPIIPVIGNEDNIDGERVWEGIVRPAMDAQRIYNYQVSKMVEATALAPMAPWVAAEGQIEGYEHIWNKANNVPYSVLPYKPTSYAGAPIPPPSRVFGEPAIQAVAQTVGQANADIQATTGFTDPSLGLPQRADQSGVAIQSLQRQAETGNSQYLDNLANISMAYEAKVILDLMPHVYDRPGRVVQILGLGDEQSAVMLNQPFVQGPNGPQPVPQGTPNAIMHALDKTAQYGVVINIGKQYSTARQEEAATLGDLISKAPALMQFFGDIWLDSLDSPGAAEAAERMKKVLDPRVLQGQPGQQPQIPPQVQAQMQAQQQQLQMAMQQLQELQSGMAKEQAKIASNERIKAAELDTQRQIEAAKLAVQRELAMLKMGNDQAQSYTQHGIAAATEAAKMQHAQEQAAYDRAHQLGMAEHAAERQPTAMAENPNA